VTRRTTTIGLLKQKHAFGKASGWRDKRKQNKRKLEKARDCSILCFKRLDKAARSSRSNTV
jgi:hypothetical protein